MKPDFSLTSVFLLFSIIYPSFSTSTGDNIETDEAIDKDDGETVIIPNVQKSSSKGNDDPV